VLFNKRSLAIAAALSRPAPHRDSLCLNCHVHQGWEGARHHPDYSPAFGVSCESCHGPAEHWLTAHYKPEWRGLGAREKEKRGLRDLRGLQGRAQSCVPCHVGTPDSDVNHDLIAAGHPRLYFEFGSYHARMPQHWSRARDLRDYPDLEARAWAVGQVVSARAALDLLIARADERHQRPWPEFAEYDCYACHHDLQDRSWRQLRGFPNRKPGALVWADWYHGLLPIPAEEFPPAAGKALAELRAEMQQPLPNRDRVLRLAGACRAALDTSLRTVEGRAHTTALLEERFLRLAEAGQKRQDLTWDGAAQHYLGLAALRHAWRDLNPGHPSATQMDQRLQGLAQQLLFPDRLDSPRDFDPEQVRGQLLRLRHPGGK
jgi:hypothetical protein